MQLPETMEILEIKPEEKENTIGRNMEDYRLDCRMAVRQVMMKTGIPESDIKSYESGEKIPDQTTLEIIAEALKVTPEQLLAAPRKRGNVILRVREGNCIIEVRDDCIDTDPEKRKAIFARMNEIFYYGLKRKNAVNHNG